MKKAYKPKRPPTHLSRRAKEWWKLTASQFVFDSESEWTLFEQCAGCVQRIDESRRDIEKHGIVVVGGTGSLKPNPAVAIERDCRVLLARLFRELHISDLHEATKEQVPQVATRRR